MHVHIHMGKNGIHDQTIKIDLHNFIKNTHPINVSSSPSSIVIYMHVRFFNKAIWQIEFLYPQSLKSS